VWIRFENIRYVMLIEAQVTRANIHKPNRKCNPLSWEFRHCVYICIAQGQALRMCVCLVCVFMWVPTLSGTAACMLSV